MIQSSAMAKARGAGRAATHKTEPPRPLGITDAGRWLFEELASTRSERISLTFEPEHHLLWRAFDEPRWPLRFGEHIHGVLARLAELEAELSASMYTLHLALVCGTPPLPVGLRVSTQPVWSDSGMVPTIVLQVFSAKELRLRGAYVDALAGRPTFSRGESRYVEARWVADQALPFLQLAVVPARGRFPSPASLERVFGGARSPVDRFFDGNTRVKDYVYALRTWALYLLVERRRMSQREALTFWNREAPPELRYHFRELGGPTQPVEGQLSQEFRLLRSRIARFTS